ncbi:hypothetical protein V6Z11_D02G011000 [Gossypium hirsutum]
MVSKNRSNQFFSQNTLSIHPKSFLKVAKNILKFLKLLKSIFSINEFIGNQRCLEVIRRAGEADFVRN